MPAPSEAGRDPPPEASGPPPERPGPPPEHPDSPPDRLRIWLLAARPKTLPAAVAPVVVGTGFAVGHGVFRSLPALAALAGALLIQVATNLANDYYDWKKGSDTAERIGPTRVTQAGLIRPGAVFRGMLVTLALAVAVGVYLVAVGGWPILAVGVLSLVSAVAYTGGPYPLAYHGLGDPFVLLFFGWVAVGGTYWVQALRLPADLLWAGTGVGALATAILVVNNLRDIDTDAAAGKRTLAVRIGRRGTRIEYVLLLLLAASVPVAGIALAGWPEWTFLSLAAFAAAADPLRRVLSAPSPEDLMPALGGTARLAVLYGFLLGLGAALG